MVVKMVTWVQGNGALARGTQAQGWARADAGMRAVFFFFVASLGSHEKRTWTARLERFP